MRKNALLVIITLLLTIMFGMFNASPTLAAPAVSAANHHMTTPKIAQSDVICRYTVTATAGLNVRSGPGVNFPIQYTLSFNQVVTAFRDNVQSGPGPNGTTISWREIADSLPTTDWAASQWLSQVPNSCVF